MVQFEEEIKSAKPKFGRTQQLAKSYEKIKDRYMKEGKTNRIKGNHRTLISCRNEMVGKGKPQANRPTTSRDPHPVSKIRHSLNSNVNRE